MCILTVLKGTCKQVKHVVVVKNPSALNISLEEPSSSQHDDEVLNRSDSKVTMGGDSFVCMPSLACRGRVTQLAYFAS
jgi:hypothetical protein